MLKVIDGEIYKFVDKLPSKMQKECKGCEFIEYDTEEVHVGYSCYDKHQFACCTLTSDSIDLDSGHSEKELFEDCPLNGLIQQGNLIIRDKQKVTS